MIKYEWTCCRVLGPSHRDGLHDLVLKPARDRRCQELDSTAKKLGEVPDPNSATVEDGHYYAKVGVDRSPLALKVAPAADHIDFCQDRSLMILSMLNACPCDLLTKFCHASPWFAQPILWHRAPCQRHSARRQYRPASA